MLYFKTIALAGALLLALPAAHAQTAASAVPRDPEANDAPKPAAGPATKGLAVNKGRDRLALDAQRRCLALDTAIPQQARQAALAPSSERDQQQVELRGLRSEFHRLGC